MKTQDTKDVKQVKALDDMQKQTLKEQKQIEAAMRAAERLEKATNRLQSLKERGEKVGFANQTIALTRAQRAESVSVQGAIDALNLYIKEVAKANSLDKKIVSTLKGEAAQTLLQQVTETTLPLYVDNKGLYKVETLYRLVASKAKNAELRALLNNMSKQASNQQG